MRYLSTELWDSFTPAQENIFKDRFCNFKNHDALTKQIYKGKQLPAQHSSSRTVAPVGTEAAALKEEESPEGKGQDNEKEQDAPENGDDANVSDFHVKQARMFSNHCNITNSKQHPELCKKTLLNI